MNVKRKNNSVKTLMKKVGAISLNEQQKKSFAGGLSEKHSIKTMNNHADTYNPTKGKKYQEQEEKGVIGRPAYLQAKATRMCS
jgi:hypothetical protein